MRVPGHERNNVSRDTGTNAGPMTTTGGVDAAGAAGGAIYYFEIYNVCDDRVTSAQISWPDAVSSAAITLEGTDFHDNEVAAGAVASYFWAPIPVTITGPAASAAGTTLLEGLGNLGVKRLRLKVVVAATTKLYVRTWGKH